MTHRIGITKAIVEGLKWDLDGTGGYYNDIQENVELGDVHFENVTQWPMITVSPGPEIRTYQPSHVTECRLNLYIRAYVRDEQNSQEQIELLIHDIETYLDNNLDLKYNVETPDDVTEEHRTVTNTIISINTSEGLLQPDEIAEIAVEVRYDKIRGI